MAGQIVREGFLDFRLPPWLQRLITALVAIVLAAAVTIAYGESGTAKLLILSQVILSLQLPFAIIPLVMITAPRAKMGELIAPRWLTIVAGVIAGITVTLNVKLIVDFITGPSAGRGWGCSERQCARAICGPALPLPSSYQL